MKYPADLEYTVQIWKEGDQFIAHAIPLDVMSAGPTVEAARVALDEAVSLFLETAAEAGTLEEVLHECGLDRVWEAEKPSREILGVVAELAGVLDAEIGEPKAEYTEYLQKKYS